MKNPLWLLLTVTAAVAQPPPTDHPSEVSEPVATSLQVRSGGPIARSTPNKPMSGAVVEAARSKNPAQMINPLAPPAYGDGWQNVSIDPVTGHAQGLKLFSLNF